MSIHPLSCVSPQAELGRYVTVGPFCVVEPGAIVGDGCELASHVIVKRDVVLGANNKLGEGCVIGGLPQHIHAPASPGGVVIGSDNVFREHVTIHRAMEAGRNTTIGSHNLLMVNAHVAHDCQLGDQSIYANNVMLAGHVTVGDHVFVSGAAGIHQFCRVGSYAMVGGQSHVLRDVPPYVMMDGVTTRIVGLNRVGLRRKGFTVEQMRQLKAAYRVIYRSGLLWSQVQERLAAEFATGPAAKFLEFFQGGTRGFTPARHAPQGATLELHDEEGEELAVTRQAKVG